MFLSSGKEIQAWYKAENKIILAEKPFWGIKFEKGKIYYWNQENLDFQETAFAEPFEVLRNFPLRNSEILIGFLGYNFADQFESNVQDKRDFIFEFPEMCFFAFREFKIVQELPFEFDCKKPQLKNFKNLIEDTKYLQMVKIAQEELQAGNTYEINLSRPFLFEFMQALNPQIVSSLLYKNNPAPHSGYLKIDSQRAICSASPECFLKKNNNQVSTFPIKGTRKRLQNFQDDQKQIEDLQASAKEAAEHLMVVDLERNDLGRIAIPGSVRVKNFATVQSFAYVHHLVSEINCTLKDNLNIFDVLAATFPSGSISGAPKIKTMQIIKQLEPFSRGAYCGCFGFIEGNGNANFSILIRTLLLHSNQAVLQVGGGIVLDSDPEFELAETYIKAQGFLDIFATSNFYSL